MSEYSDDYKGQYIGDLPTPAGIIDLGRVQRNAERMKCVVDAANESRTTSNGLARPSIALLPHSKTPYGIREMLDIAKEMGGAKGFLASRAREGEVLWRLGFRDHIFFAFPLADKRELERVKVLTGLAGQTSGAIISLLVANKEGINIVKSVFGEGPYPDIYSAINVGGGREGRHWRHNDAIDTTRYAHQQFGDSFAGVNEYTGRAYGIRSRDSASLAQKLVKFMRTERERISGFVKKCEKEGIPVREVGFGSTPTALTYRDTVRSRITQLHPGIFLAGDNTTHSLGLIPPEDLAVSALLKVVDRREEVTRPHGGKPRKVGRVLLGPGGSKFVSSDSAPHAEGRTHSYGRIFEDMLGNRLMPHVGVVKLSEEMPWADIPLEVLQRGDHFKIGSTVRVLVAHACPAIANMAASGRLFLVEGDRVLGRANALALGYDALTLDPPPEKVFVPADV